MHKKTSRIKNKSDKEKAPVFSRRVDDMIVRGQLNARETMHYKMDAEHLCKALIDDPMGIIPALARAIGLKPESFIEDYNRNYATKYIGLSNQEKFASDLKDAINSGYPPEKIFGQELTALFEDAEGWAKVFGNDIICSQHIALAILEQSELELTKLLEKEGVNREVAIEFLAEELEMRQTALDYIKSSISLTPPATVENMPKAKPPTKTTQAPLTEEEDILSVLNAEERKVFDTLAKDLTAEIAAAKPVIIGRREELAKLYEMLSRKVKNAPVICGPAGTGKTTLVELLCLEIADKTAPEEFLGKKVFSINCGNIIENSKFRGEMETRLKHLMSAMQKIGRKAIWYIDEVHNILLGRTGGLDEGTNGSIGDSFKPMLSNPYMPVLFIGSTTEQEFKMIEKDSALARRFGKILISEPKKEYAIQIIQALIPHYAGYHKIKADPLLAEFIYEKSKQIQGRVVPDVSVDIIDISLSKCKLRKIPELQKEIIEESVADLMGRVKKSGIGFFDEK